MRLETYKMATSILLKFQTLKCDISRTIWRIEVSDGSLFCIFHALSFECNLFFDRTCPLSKKCLKFKSRSNKKKRKKNEYFDPDCYSKRKELQRLGKLLSEKPNDINIRHSYFQIKKLYKNMIKLKKRSFKENRLKLIGDLGHTDISQKWQILKSLTEGGEIKDELAQEISLDRWKQYFQELYNNSQVDDNLPKSFSVEKKAKRNWQRGFRDYKTYSKLSIFKKRNTIL